MRAQGFRYRVLAIILVSVGMWIASGSASALEVGAHAPDFLMHSTVGESVRLSDFQGKKNVMLFFFVAAFTGV
jgi:AhpC/TSA family protein